MKALYCRLAAMAAVSVLISTTTVVAADKPGGPLSPQEELATFRVPEGFRVELVASEPEVVDPVAMTFDADGRIYVVEMAVTTKPYRRSR